MAVKLDYSAIWDAARGIRQTEPTAPQEPQPEIIDICKRQEPADSEPQPLSFWACFMLITTLSAGLIPYEEKGQIKARKLYGGKLTPEEESTISDRRAELAEALERFDLREIIETYCRGEDLRPATVYEDYTERLGLMIGSARDETLDEALRALACVFTVWELFKKHSDRYREKQRNDERAKRKKK